MKKVLFVFCLILQTLVVFSQNAEADKSFKKGLKALELKNYQEAVNQFTISLDIAPEANSFYNRSVAYYYLGDTCSFCNDLKSAAQLKDSQAENLYIEKCLDISLDYNVPDSIRQNNRGISHFKRVYDKCTTDSTIVYIFEDKKTDSLLVADEALPVFMIVEQMPEYPGGDAKKNEYLAKNIVYPEYATKKGIQGTVYVSFIIATDGSVSNVKLLRGIGGGCDEEALRVVREMPKWIPGRQNGEAVRVLYNMPVYFKLRG